MTTQELIQLLKPIFKEVLFSEGKLSLVEAVDVIEEFKSQIQDEAIEKFTKTYGFLYEKKIAERAKILNSREYENSKKTLVRCK